jgi:hypothetical protein
MAPRHSLLLPCLLLAALCCAGPALAAAYDPMTVTQVRAGHGKLAVTLQAGSSGAPAGFTLWWMSRADFEAYGAYWSEGPVAGKAWASFTGAPTLNTMGGTLTSFRLAPGQVIEVELGDLFDETGVTTNTPEELVEGLEYVLCGFANGDAGGARSPITTTSNGNTTISTNCTYTQGFWKNHPEVWPVAGLTLGAVPYTQAELLAILGQPAAGNGLVSLAHQLIAAKLNIANGANPTAAAAAIAAADALIGGLVVPPVGGGYLAPASTSALTQTLDDYNNGIIGPGHCGETPATPSTWGRMKALYR